MLFTDNLFYAVDKDLVVTNMKKFAKIHRLTSYILADIEVEKITYIEKEIDSEFHSELDPLSTLFITYKVSYGKHAMQFKDMVSIPSETLSEWADVGFLENFKILEFNDIHKLMETNVDTSISNEFVELLRSSLSYYSEVSDSPITSETSLETIREKVISGTFKKRATRTYRKKKEAITA